MLSSEFLSSFKRETEEKWREKPIDPRTFGFQFQAGTRWNPGLSDIQILSYEDEVGIRFSSDFKAFLRAMNGTDVPTLNIFGNSDGPSREWLGVYVFPRDLNYVRRCISEANENRTTLTATLSEQGFALSTTAKFMPIYAHRFVVCDDAQDGSPVLSIYDSEDAIVYGYTLQEYLEREFLGIVPNWAI